MKKTIDPKPIIKELAGRCLKAKGLECSLLGEVIDMLKAAPAARHGICQNCDFCNFNSSNGTYKCRSMKGLYRTVEPDEYCSYFERS